jgi:hypothetical protein
MPKLTIKAADDEIRRADGAAERLRFLTENPPERDWAEPRAECRGRHTEFDPPALVAPTGKMRWPKIVNSSSTPPARPQPAFTNISAATCDFERTHRSPSSRSGTPVIVANLAGRSLLGGVELNRVRLMKIADAKNEAAFRMNATLRPERVPSRGRQSMPGGQHGRPGGARQCVGGHQFIPQTLRSNGRRARRFEERLRGDANSRDDVRNPDLFATADEQQAEDHDTTEQIRDDHQSFAIDAVDHHACERTYDRHREKLHDHHPGNGSCRSGQVQEERVDGDGIEPSPSWEIACPKYNSRKFLFVRRTEEGLVTRWPADRTSIIPVAP